jgi:hypothetical protein
METKRMAKRILLDLFSALPYTGVIVHEWDSIENDKRFIKIEKDIDRIFEMIENPSRLHLEEPIIKLLMLIDNEHLLPNFNFKKMASCLAIIKEVNLRSIYGQAVDPFIELEDLVKIIEAIDNTKNPLDEIKLAVYELKKNDLIYDAPDARSPLGFHAIYPKEYFFCKTDCMYQSWDPKSDALEIIKLLIAEKDGMMSVENIDTAFTWGPRRLNSSIALLYLNGLINRQHELGGVKYILPWLWLTEEAYLNFGT